jgi:hypothetical protein
MQRVLLIGKRYPSKLEKVLNVSITVAKYVERTYLSNSLGLFVRENIKEATQVGASMVLLGSLSFGGLLG